ncbi:MAG: SGNH family hydrolase [Alphaproteobacteria bacterium]
MPEAQAQGIDERYPHLFAPRGQQPRLIRIPQQQRNIREDRPRAARRTAPAVAEAIRPQRERPDPNEPRPEPTTHVLVLGDNLAEWLSYGLEEAFEDVPELGFLDRSKTSSGLVKADFYDWVTATPDLLRNEAKVDFIVVMFGSNDRQSFTIGTETIELRSERWQELYVQRIDAVMAALKTRGVPVFWVGLPPIRGARITADMAYFNGLYKERAERAGIAYVDVWPGFIDEQGQYTQFGPDFAGQIRRLRTGDGVHFTDAGARKLALFLEQDIRRALVGRLAPVAPTIEPERPLSPGLGIPIPEAAVTDLEASGLVAARPRPLSGPVLPLAGRPAIPAQPNQPASTAAELVGARGPDTLRGPAATVLTRGDALTPVPGRIDDFRWPPQGEGAGAAPAPTR